MALTFTTLKTAIQDYTQNTESTFVDNLSRFIVNAEERILKETQLEVFRKYSQGSASSSNKFLTKPNDYLAPFDGFTASTIEQSTGYTITKVTDSTYTFTAVSGTATAGDIIGGGAFASAGPVTVDA